MPNPKMQNPVWAWIVLIGGGFFLLTSFPGLLLTVLIPFWKPDELGFFTYIYMTIALGILIAVIWGIKRAINALMAYNRAKKDIQPFVDTPFPEILQPGTASSNRKVWPWTVIVFGALILLIAGPGVIMLLMAPLFLAGMSTDSGSTPEYVPILIVTIGYGLIIGFIILLIKAIKTLRSK